MGTAGNGDLTEDMQVDGFAVEAANVTAAADHELQKITSYSLTARMMRRRGRSTSIPSKTD